MTCSNHLQPSGGGIGNLAVRGNLHPETRVQCNLTQVAYLLPGYPDDPVKINDIMVSPDPPVRGQNMTVTIVGDAFSRVKVCYGELEPLCTDSRAHRKVHTPMLV